MSDSKIQNHISSHAKATKKTARFQIVLLQYRQYSHYWQQLSTLIHRPSLHSWSSLDPRSNTGNDWHIASHVCHQLSQNPPPCSPEEMDRPPGHPWIWNLRFEIRIQFNPFRTFRNVTFIAIIIGDWYHWQKLWDWFISPRFSPRDLITRGTSHFTSTRSITSCFRNIGGHHCIGIIYGHPWVPSWSVIRESVSVRTRPLTIDWCLALFFSWMGILIRLLHVTFGRAWHLIGCYCFIVFRSRPVRSGPVVVVK